MKYIKQLLLSSFIALTLVYAIYDFSSMTGAKWDDVVQSATTARRDIDTGATCIIKWETGSEPSWIGTESITTYNRTDLKAEMTTQGIWDP